MDRALYERMFEANVRIENAWPFPVCGAPDDLLEMFEDCGGKLPEQIEALIANWAPEERQELFDGLGDGEAFDELCCSAFNLNVMGWIGVAASPVFKAHADGKGATFSWGHYRTKLLFSPTADDLLIAASVWAEQSYQDALAKAKAAA